MKVETPPPDADSNRHIYNLLLTIFGVKAFSKQRRTELLATAPAFVNNIPHLIKLYLPNIVITISRYNSNPAIDF